MGAAEQSEERCDHSGRPRIRPILIMSRQLGAYELVGELER